MLRTGGRGGWWCRAGGGFTPGCGMRRRAQNSGCDLSDSRKEGVKHEPAGLHGLRYANWRLAGAERGSAELRGTLAQSHHSLLPSPPLPSPPSPSSPSSLASPGPLPHLLATAERSPCFPPPGVVMCVCVSVCLCWNAASPSAGACVYVWV